MPPTTTQCQEPCILDFASTPTAVFITRKRQALGPIYNWVTPTTSAPNYEVFVSVTGDELSTGTIDSWIALTSTQSWNILSVGVRKEAVLTVSIRPTGGSAIDTATITLGAGEAV
jgi:hypothetical protein